MRKGSNAWMFLETAGVTTLFFFLNFSSLKSLGNPYRGPQDKETHLVCAFQSSVVLLKCETTTLYEFEFFGT